MSLSLGILERALDHRGIGVRSAPLFTFAKEGSAVWICPFPFSILVEPETEKRKPRLSRVGSSGKMSGFSTAPKSSAVNVRLYTFFRVEKIPTTAPIRVIGANLTNNHSNA